MTVCLPGSDFRLDKNRPAKKNALSILSDTFHGLEGECILPICGSPSWLLLFPLRRATAFGVDIVWLVRLLVVVAGRMFCGVGCHATSKGS